MVRSGPYGKVDYGDPGYQPDGKPRYPLDTELHVRNAWSRINQEEDAAKYTKPQLEAIHHRIQRAGKRYGIAYGHARTRSRTARRRGVR